MENNFEKFDKEFDEKFPEIKKHNQDIPFFAMDIKPQIKSFFHSFILKDRQEVREGVIKEIKEPLEIILDFVERWNKQDREVKVANATYDITQILENLKNK